MVFLPIYVSENFSGNFKIIVLHCKDSAKKNPVSEDTGFLLKGFKIRLFEQRQDHLRRLVRLGKHGGTGLEQDLVLGKGCHFRYHIHIADC